MSWERSSSRTSSTRSSSGSSSDWQEARTTKPARKDDSGNTLALAILSLLAAIPISAIAATHAGIVALIVVWAGIVLVNLAYARRR